MLEASVSLTRAVCDVSQQTHVSAASLSSKPVDQTVGLKFLHESRKNKSKPAVDQKHGMKRNQFPLTQQRLEILQRRDSSTLSVVI